ncbi:MAG: GlsB/YeaQ/YmgE family stress response membrane protein [Actinobacteria bacterium]|nr:GlsB/YeaQ/YmgE family stress response membrane protein [Actinomycetota bacterium]
MIGAIILGLVAGAIARFLIKGDALERVGGVLSWILTLVLGLVGAWLGWWIFTGLFGIGDDDMFDLGGIVGAIIGAVVVLAVVTWIVNRTARA